MKKVLIIAGVVMVVAGSLVYYQTKSNNQQSLPITVLPAAATNTLAKIETPSSWKTYKHDILNFEFQYPDSYTITGPDVVVDQEVMSSEEGEILQINTDGDIKIGVSFNANGIRGLSQKEIKQEGGYFYELDYIDDSGKKIWRKEVAKSGEYPTFFDENSFGENCTTENICLYFYHILNLKGESVAVFTADVDAQKVDTNMVSLFRNNFDKIVKSFVVLK